MRRSGAGVEYPSARKTRRWVPQNPGPRTLIVHVCQVNSNVQVLKCYKCSVTGQDSKNSNRVMVTFFFWFFFSLNRLGNIEFVLEFFALKTSSRVLNQLFQRFVFEFTVSLRLLKETLEKFLLIKFLHQRTISSFLTVKKIVITLVCILENNQAEV